MGITDNEVIDIQLESPKKKFRINGDNTKMIELNPSDINIVSRLHETYKKLRGMATQAGSLLVDQQETDVEEELAKVSEALTNLDKEMRDMIDYIFDSPVSEVLANGMNMYSPFNGEFWFEHCIEVLSKLYENNLDAEFAKMKTKVQKHTAKYTGKS